MAYPATLDNLPTNHGTGDVIQPSHVNDPANAVNNVQAELGVTPKGFHGSVALRLNDTLGKLPSQSIYSGTGALHLTAPSAAAAWPPLSVTKTLTTGEPVDGSYSG